MLAAAIKKTLEQDGGSDLIDCLPAFVAANIGLNQEPVGLCGCQPLIPGLHRDNDSFLQHCRKLPSFFGRGPIAAIHVSRHANEDKFNLFVFDQLLQTVEKGAEWLGWNSLERLSQHPELVAEREPDSLCSMVYG
jgi:hypothetical protein